MTLAPRLLRLLVLAAACLSALLAGRPALADPGRLVVWHAYRGDEEKALAEILARTSELGWGLPIDTLSVPYEAYGSKLAATVPSGHGPDVFIDAHERLGDYLLRGIVAPVGEIDERAFAPGTLEPLRQGGELYGLPIAEKCLALYVNTDLVREVPPDLEGIAALAPRLPPGVFPIAYEATSAYAHAALLSAFGGTMLAADGSFGMTGAGAARSVALARELVTSGAAPAEASGALVGELFASGRAATAVSGPWLASDLAARVHYRVVPLPRVRETGRAMRPLLTIEAAMLTPSGAKRPAARALLAWLAGPEAAEIRGRVGRQVVARAEAPGGSSDPFLAAFAAQARDAVPMPASAAMRATWVPAQQAIRRVVEGGAAPEDALDEAKRRFDDAMRPMPPAASTTPPMLIAGLAMLGAAYALVRRARAGGVGRVIVRSLPAYAYVTHAVVAVGLLVVLPLAVGAATSFFAGSPREPRYVGLANYVAILTARGGPLLASGSFYRVLLVTVLWTVANLALHLALGLGLGLLLARPTLKLRGLYRVLLIVPWAVPSYVTALAWKGMFHRQFGAVTALLVAVGAEPISWFARFSTAFTANVATNAWLGFPFMMVVTLGALTGIPKDVVEAAEVDGATRWQTLTRVTLPMIAPVLGPAVLLGAIWTFNMFNVVFLVSGGEPDGATDILVSEAYRWAFTRQAQYGYAAAYAVLIFALLAGFSRLSGRAPKSERNAVAIAEAAS